MLQWEFLVCIALVKLPGPNYYYLLVEAISTYLQYFGRMSRNINFIKEAMH
jgi:hypothetical protein